MRTTLLCTGAAVAAACTVVGCSSGVDPGDTVVFRIAYADTELSSSCYNGNTPVNVRSDSSTLRKSGTLILFAGTQDQLYLDTGDVVLEGTGADKSYTFDGKTVDVDYTRPNGQGAKITATTTTHIEMTVDSDAVTGTRTDKKAIKCSGGTSNECVSIGGSCTGTTDFVGTQVDERRDQIAHVHRDRHVVVAAQRQHPQRVVRGL